jgi:hypothetical protein
VNYGGAAAGETRTLSLSLRLSHTPSLSFSTLTLLSFYLPLLLFPSGKSREEREGGEEERGKKRGNDVRNFIRSVRYFLAREKSRIFLLSLLFISLYFHFGLVHSLEKPPPVVYGCI